MFRGCFHEFFRKKVKAKSKSTLKMKNNLKSIMKNNYVNIAKIILSILLILFLFYKIDVRIVFLYIRNLKIHFLLFAYILVFFNVYLNAFKWRTLLLGGKNIIIKDLCSYILIGFFFNNFFPSSMGGDISRTIQVMKHCDNKFQAAASLIMVRLTGMVVSVVISLTSLIFISKLLGNSQLTMLIVISGLAFFAMLYIFFNKRIMVKFGNWVMKRFYSISSFLKRLYDSVYIYRHKKGALSKAFLITIIFQFSTILIHYILALAIDVNVKFIYFCFFIPLIYLIIMLPISFNGLGVREGSFVFFFTKVGASSAEALSLSLLAFSLWIVLSVAGGIILLISNLNSYSRSN